MSKATTPKGRSCIAKRSRYNAASWAGKSDTLSANNLASALQHEGHYAEAEKSFREALDVQRRVLGPEDPDTLLSANNLATLCSTKPTTPMRRSSIAKSSTYDVVFSGRTIRIH